MRESWTDARLDDFRGEVDRRFDGVDARFDKVDARFDKVEGEIGALRTEMGSRFDKVDARFERVEGRIDDLHKTIHRTLVQLGGGLVVTVAIGFASIIVQL